MEDYIIRATAADGLIRAFVGSFRNTVWEAARIHNTTPVASAVLGRTLVITSIMGLMLKGDDEIITVNIKGDGPVGGVLATSDNKGRVKGYLYNPTADLPLKQNGKLDVGGALGKGVLNVIKDLGLKEPYVSQMPLVSGEIAEDFTHYFTKSEQTPSAVSLGVLVDRDYSIKQAGGFVIQLMPGASDEMADRIQEKLADIKAVTTLLESGKTPEDILKDILGEYGTEILETYSVSYYCNCSKSRVEKALISIGEKDIKKILEEDKQAELNCHFCNKSYSFDEAELMAILDSLKK